MKLGREWETIKRFPKYLINKRGEIYSLYSMKKLKLCEDKDGYICLHLFKDKKGHCVKVHRLVLEQYNHDIKNLVCNHKNGIKSDNRLKNLELVTIQKNNIHKIHILKLGLKKVSQYDSNLNLIKNWDSIKIASTNLNIHSSNIVNCCKGRHKTCKGFIWKYT